MTKRWLLYRSPVGVEEAGQRTLSVIEQRISQIMNDKDLPPSIRLRLYNDELRKHHELREQLRQKGAMTIQEEPAQHSTRTTEQQVQTDEQTQLRNPARQITEEQEEVQPDQQVQEDDNQWETDEEQPDEQPASAGPSAAGPSPRPGSKRSYARFHLGVDLSGAASREADYLVYEFNRKGIKWNADKEVLVADQPVGGTSMRDIVTYISSTSAHREPPGTTQVLEQMIKKGIGDHYIRNPAARARYTDIAKVFPFSPRRLRTPKKKKKK